MPRNTGPWLAVILTVFLLNGCDDGSPATAPDLEHEDPSQTDLAEVHNPDLDAHTTPETDTATEETAPDALQHDVGQDADSPPPPCGEGQVSRRCQCSTQVVTTGHCCDGQPQQEACPIYLADYYVAPDGDDHNSGRSIDDPFRTWSKAFTTAQAGDLVYIRGGLYLSEAGLGGERGFNSGTATQPIRFFNYPGEVPILDCSSRVTTESGYNKGIAMWGVHHIHLKGLQIHNVLQNHVDVNVVGLEVWRCGNIVLEELTVRNVDGEGVVIADYEDTILVKNCDASELSDSLRSAEYPTPGSPGQNGAGFQYSNHGRNGQTAIDSRLYFEGCRAWNFSDNGFAGSSVGYVEFDRCWAFDGGHLSGEGCGFKTGSLYGGDVNDLPLARVIKNCIGAFNGAYGFSPNNRGDTPMNAHFFNNLAYHNGYKGTGHGLGHGFVILAYAATEPAPNERYANNISFGNEIGEVNERAPYRHDHNSWDLPLTFSHDDFVSLDLAQLSTPRQADGSLPEIAFGRLRPDSAMIDAGVDVGLPYTGEAPDLGPFENN